MADEMGEFAVFPPFIVADDGCNGQTGDRRNQQNIQETIVGFCIWNRVKSAAVVPAVTHADHGQWLFKPLAIQLHSIGRVDAAKDIDQDGEYIGAGTSQKWQPFIAADLGADAGIKPNGADIDGPVAAGMDQIKGGFITAAQTL